MRFGRTNGKRAMILLLIFLAAMVAWFLRPTEKKEKEGDVAYTAMEEATLPVIYPQMLGREMAPLFGHMEEGAVTADRDSLLVLPADRALPIRIDEAWEVRGIRYEIRSLDLARLVERTELSDWTVAEGGISLTLPIQNLLETDEQYLLGISLDLSDGRNVWYYTRIVETENTHVSEMISLAEEFSLKSLDYEAAQDLTMYMESSAGADNSSFGNVTLKNSFTQITWGGLHVEREGQVYVTLKELSGNLANVQLDYHVRRVDEETGEPEHFKVSENFTMKWATQRIYMMDFEREMDEFFVGDREAHSGRRILLGINSGRDIYAKKSADGKVMAYVNNGNLWAYDTREDAGGDALFSREDGRSVLVFSFGEAGAQEDLRAGNDRHGIEILEVEETGNISFLVYGYMNRGVHEGRTGISYYYYDAHKNQLEEKFFLPAEESFEQLEKDLRILAHKGGNGILYFYMDQSVYGIDLTSYEYVVVASGLTDDKFAVSKDGSRLAWQDNTGVYDSQHLSVMDLDTGEKHQIGGDFNDVYRILGFVGSDCVYGVGTRGDYILSNGRTMGVFLRSVEIVDRAMKPVKSYEKEGSYICGVRVEESRIHIRNTASREMGFFAPYTEDTLVCNVETLPGRMDDIGWYASDEKGRVYFVQLPEEVKADDRIRVLSPETLALEGTKEILLTSVSAADTMDFYAYGRGRFLGRYVNFSDAVNAAYDSMGFVCAGKSEVLWVRGNKANSANIRDYTAASRRLERNRENFRKNQWAEDESLMLDLSGCTLNQALYFVGNGAPVLVYRGEGSFLYLIGYDQTSVRVFDPALQSVETWELSMAEEYLKKAGNDYISCVFTE